MIPHKRVCPGGELLTPAQVAQQLNVSPVTVRYWAQHGLLPCVTTAGGHRRFLQRDIAEFARTRCSAAVPPALRILIVDRDAGFSSYLGDILDSLKKPIEWTIASDGYSAGVQTLLFSPDILIIDTTTIGMDGSTLMRQLEKLPGIGRISVIAMTQQPVERAALLAIGVDAVLTKPFTKSLLLEQLGKLTDRDMFADCF